MACLLASRDRGGRRSQRLKLCYHIDTTLAIVDCLCELLGRAIVELFLQTGIRVSEAAKLDNDDVALPEAQGLPLSVRFGSAARAGRNVRITLNS